MASSKIYFLKLIDGLKFFWNRGGFSELKGTFGKNGRASVGQCEFADKTSNLQFNALEMATSSSSMERQQ